MAFFSVRASAKVSQNDVVFVVSLKLNAINNYAVRQIYMFSWQIIFPISQNSFFVESFNAVNNSYAGK